MTPGDEPKKESQIGSSFTRFCLGFCGAAELARFPGTDSSAIFLKTLKTDKKFD
jgi:hypothetical protein